MPPKKKKPLVLTNVGKRAVGGGDYIPVSSVYLKNSEPSVSGIISRIKYGYGRTYLPTQRTCRKRAGKKKKKNPVINPGQLAGKGRKKKTLVLNLGRSDAYTTNAPEKGKKKKKKKNPGINPGQLAGKGRGKKNPGINPGQPAGKGRGKKTLVFNPGQIAGPQFQDLDGSQSGTSVSRPGQTDKQVN
jgi:hypothetical protein